MIVTKDVIHVIQGEYAVSHQPDIVLTTVLGSCVSACMFDPVRRLGGMNHFLLPDSADAADLRFASAAMERLVNALLKAGADRHQLKAKLFGGAQMMSGLPDIGSRNSEAASRFLRMESIPILSASLGGNEARRVRFWPTTGRAQLLLVGRAIEEKPPASRPVTGSIELF